MRYERRGTDVSSKPPWSTRRRRITALSSAIVVAMAGVIVGVNLARGPHKVVVIEAIAKPYLAANILIQNLGSPAPQGVTSSSWAIVGDGLVGATTTSPHLAVAERKWIDASGKVVQLPRAQGAAIVANQRQLAASIMTGELLSTTEHQINQVVRAEYGSHPTISSPGGGAIVGWYSIAQNGATASVDATVNIWVQVDELVNTPSGLRISSLINQAEIEGRATLVRSHGVWKVATLNQVPYQQAT